MSTGKDDKKYFIDFKGGKEKPDDWPAAADYKIAVTDPASGLIEGSLDGKVWFTYTQDDWKTKKLKMCAVAAEILHSVDQVPGTSANPCAFADVQVATKGKWAAAAFPKRGGRTIDLDVKGKAIVVSTSHAWGFGAATATGFTIWDKHVEHLAE